MPCCLLFALMGLPRAALFALAVFGDTISEAFHAADQSLGLAFAGFLFLPWTTLWFTWAIRNGGGQLETWHWIILVLAAASDLGMTRGGLQQRSSDAG